MFSTLLKRFLRNPFFWALLFSIGTIGTTIYALLSLLTLQAALIGGIAFCSGGFLFFSMGKRMKKWLLCEFSLFGATLAAAFLPSRFKKKWYTQISDRITLGANPLISRSHLEDLQRTGHTAILSMIEPFEMEPHVCGVPVKPQEWFKAGMAFLNLPTPDLKPVRCEDVMRGVAFLRQQILEGGRVYVHCNAGVIRSATIVICYLIAYSKMTAKEAVEFVKSKRAIVVNKNSPAVIDFIKSMQRSSIEAV